MAVHKHFVCFGVLLACALAAQGFQLRFSMAGPATPEVLNTSLASKIANSTWRWGEPIAGELASNPVQPIDELDHGIYVEGGCQSAACWETENQLLRKRLFSMRQQLGNLSCLVNHIGPTGGFCLAKDAAHVGGNDFIDTALADRLAALFARRSVLDLGCGLGQYGRYFAKNQGANITWVGYDGAENVADVTHGYVKWADLTVPQWLGQQFDWVLSLEVAEHIPPELQGAFLGNLVRHARHGVVLSWAVPGQAGHHHVNCRSNADASRAMAALGFEPDAALTAHLQKTAQIPWLKNTVMVFWRPAARSNFTLPAGLPSSFAPGGVPLLAARVRAAWADLLGFVRGLAPGDNPAVSAARSAWEGK